MGGSLLAHEISDVNRLTWLKASKKAFISSIFYDFFTKISHPWSHP
jgi:hypothetical protein